MPTSVFISYSHDSPEHKDFVRSLADTLRDKGLDCQIDQYINGFPAEGWQRWMETQIEESDFVLIVCTETYLKRFRGLDADGGRGVNFEGVVISQTLYDSYYRNTKFIPVIPDNGSMDNVPLPLKAYSTYTLMRDFTELYRVLTDQHATPAPEIGEKLKLSETSRTDFSVNQAQTNEIHKTETIDKITTGAGMTDTMKATWLAGAFALIAAIIAGLFTLSSAPSVTITGSPCAKVNTGSESGSTTQDCGDKNGK